MQMDRAVSECEGAVDMQHGCQSVGQAGLGQSILGAESDDPAAIFSPQTAGFGSNAPPEMAWQWHSHGTRLPT